MKDCPASLVASRVLNSEVFLLTRAGIGKRGAARRAGQQEHTGISVKHFEVELVRGSSWNFGLVALGSPGRHENWCWPVQSGFGRNTYGRGTKGGEFLAQFLYPEEAHHASAESSVF